MIDENQLELIQADVDGELPEQHRAELSRLLLASPEARAAHEELKRICGTLDQVRPIEPPAGLGAAILSSVRLPAQPAASHAGRPGWAQWRIAAAFAGGLLVSGLAFQMSESRLMHLDASDIAGTLVSRDPGLPLAPTETLEVSLEQASGTVSLYQSTKLRVIEFDFAVRQPLEVVVMHDGQEVRFSRLGHAGSVGHQRYALVLDGAGVDGLPVEVRFLTSGREIHRGTLEAVAPR